MRTVYKYKLGRYRTTLALPYGAKILHADMQGEDVHLWVLVNTSQTNMEERIFVVVGTGWDLKEWAPGGALEHISTVMDGSFVWHVFENVNAWY